MANGELAVNPERPARRPHPGLGRREEGPDRRRARGRLLPDAVALMQEVGWEAAPAVADGGRRPAAGAGVGGGGRGGRRRGVAPLLALPLSFVGQGDALDQIAADLLPDALRASIVLGSRRGSGDARARRRAGRARVLLGLPRPALAGLGARPAAGDAGLRARVRAAGPVRLGEPVAAGAARDPGRRLPAARVRSTAGAITVLTLVLYPYVYLLGRTAFLDQSRETLEAARTLGLGHRRAVLRVALPLARPALAAGAALAVMEALADFGAVNLLNYRAMTDAIYRVWYGAFDQAAALQLASVLVSLALLMVVARAVLRGRARYHRRARARRGRRRPAACTVGGPCWPRRPRAWCWGSCSGCRSCSWCGRLVGGDGRGGRWPSWLHEAGSTRCCWRRSPPSSRRDGHRPVVTASAARPSRLVNAAAPARSRRLRGAGLGGGRRDLRAAGVGGPP